MRSECCPGGGQLGGIWGAPVTSRIGPSLQCDHADPIRGRIRSQHAVGRFGSSGLTSVRASRHSIRGPRKRRPRVGAQFIVRSSTIPGSPYWTRRGCYACLPVSLWCWATVEPLVVLWVAGVAIPHACPRASRSRVTRAVWAHLLWLQGKRGVWQHQLPTAPPAALQSTNTTNSPGDTHNTASESNIAILVLLTIEQ